MKKIKRMMSVVVLFSWFLLGTAVADELRIFTEEYPPYNYTENGVVTGLVTDVVREVAARVGSVAEIRVLPWARAYDMIQRQDKIVLFSMTRTESREQLFKWVGPVAGNRWVFFARRDSTVTAPSLDLARKVGRIGVYLEDAVEIFLENEGFTNLDSVADDDLNVPRLIHGRIDLWATGELPGRYKARRMGVEEKLTKVLDIKEMELYIAFSRDVPDEVVALWQAALDSLKADGTYESIVQKYL